MFILEKRTRILSLAMILTLCFSAMGNPILKCNFQSEDSLDGWNKGAESKLVKLSPSSSLALEIDVQEKPLRKGTVGAYKKLDIKEVAGKKISVTVDVKGVNIAQPRSRWGGGTVMLSIHSPKGGDWPKVRTKTGTFDWERVTLDAVIPENATKVYLHLGFQDSYGKLYFRNLTVKVSDTIVDLKQSANMGYIDPVAKDGKGGWSDQGPDNDASKFDYKKKVFGNVPFQPIDPKLNDGKSVLVFKSTKFSTGLEQAKINFDSEPVAGKYLYLLHTLTWGKTNSKPVGFVKVIGEKGCQQTIEVIGGQDVADWWGAKNLKNCYVGASWQNSSGGFVGMYVSCFSLDDELGKIASITFETANSIPIWIVSAATISENKYNFPEAEKIVIKDGKDWRKVVQTENYGVIPASPLDLSSWLPKKEAGASGRVIVNKDGRLAFEDNPDKTIRFFASSEGFNAFTGRGKIVAAQLTTKENIEKYVNELHMHGFNMMRMHFLDAVVMKGAKKDLEFNEKYLDRFDYLVYCLKKRGMYLNLDAMASNIGYSTGNPWSHENKKRVSFKFSIHFDDKTRQNWIEGITKVLCHVNPYTKTRLVDDPVLAIIHGYNEQEGAFMRPNNWSMMRGPWREFLKQKYNSIDNLIASWGKASKTMKSFDDITAFTITQSSKSDNRGKDIGEFITQTEENTYKWYEEQLEKIGYKGIVTNYNLGKSMRYNLVRKDMDMVTMNTYHAHPSLGTRSGSVIDQSSSISRAGNTNRLLTSTKIINKPFVITEQAHVFWNKYRYEQSFVTGAYAAFQNYDGITYFSQPIAIVPVNGIYTFAGRQDPIAQVQNFLNFFMYIRGDIKPANSSVRIDVNTDGFFNKIDFNSGMSSHQSRLALIADLNVALTGKDSNLTLRENEVAINSTGGSIIVNNMIQGHAGFNKMIDNDDTLFNLDKFVKNMKDQGLLQKDNRTDPNNEIFETCTGEMFMDCRKNFMSIDTPRLQGICAEAGIQYELSSIKIDQMTQRGNLTVVSMDGEKNITDAKRLMLTYASDALNSNMAFDDKTRRTIRSRGTSPVLLRTGAFSITINSKHAKDMAIYVIEIDGSRRLKLEPEVEDNKLTFSVDTATLKGGPALFFEITTDK